MLRIISFYLFINSFQIPFAQQAVKEMRGVTFRGRKLQVDYASRECQETFYDHIEKQSSSTHTPFDNT